MTTKIRGNQITQGELDNSHLSASAAIQLSKLEKTVISADGTSAFTADQSAGGHRFTNLGAPASSNDAATKSYVDAIATGMSPKASCLFGTIGNIANILTAAKASVESQLDTVNSTVPNLATGNRILVKSQTNKIENGIYFWDSTANSGAGGLVRAADADNSPDGEIKGGIFTFIITGDTLKGSGWVLIKPTGSVALGTDQIEFDRFSEVQVSTGEGIDKTGNVITIQYDNSTVGVNGSNQLYVKNTGINTAQIADNSVTDVKLSSSSTSDTNRAVGTNHIKNTSVTAAKLNSDTAGAGIKQNATSYALDVDFVRQNYTATASQSNFTLSATPVTDSELVFLNGILQEKGAGADYQLSGTTVSFNTALNAGEKVFVFFLK